MNAFLTKLGNWLRNILPLGNAPKTMVLLFGFVVLFVMCIVWGKRAHADDAVDATPFQPYSQLSLGRTAFRGGAPALNLGWTWAVPQSKSDMLMTSVSLIGSSRFQGIDAPNNYAFGVQYVTGLKQLDIGLGPSWMENPGPYNGSHVNFNLMLGYRFKRWPATIWWDHYSCGGACSPNYGRDLLLIGYRL
jgi:hypothetical protein